MQISAIHTYTSRTPFLRIFFDPTWSSFAGSLILSAIAIYCADIPNRDGMLYINTASVFLEEGLTAARTSFDWVFFPVLIAYVARITSLSLETSAYFLNTLLFAGVCATLVRIVKIQFSSAAWYACVVVLTLPAFNAQRNEIIREVGWWLFCLQALLAALRWQRQPGFSRGLFVQGLLAIACLFRVEGVVFFGALALWQFLTHTPWRQRLKHLLTLTSLPILIGAALLGALTLGHLEVGSRITNYALAANPIAALAKFKAIASQFGSAVLNEYSADEADSILFFGLIGTAVRKFITNNGILLIPLAFFFFKRLRHHLSTWQPQAQFFFIYALALAAFVIHHLFISARYVVFLNILTTPLIAIGLQHMFDTIPRWRAVFVLCLAITALANVVSLSNNKAYFREAGEWLAARSEISSVTYIDDSRTRYFSGSAFKSDKKGALNSQEIEEAISQGKIDYLVLYLSRRNTVRAQWANSLELEETKRFANKAGDAVLIFQRKKSP